MKCRICNADIKNIQWNSDHEEWDPCGTCLQIISEVFGEEGDDEHEVILGDADPEEVEAVREDIPWLPEYAPRKRSDDLEYISRELREMG